MKNKKVVSKTRLAIIAGVATLVLWAVLPRSNNLTKNSVMILHPSLRSGGSGLILTSTESESIILTNSHVCGLVTNGGIVRNSQGDFPVTAYKKSELHDLCLVTVSADFNTNTVISSSPPVLFSAAQISGHPNLYPNVISTGHFSGDALVPVLVGFEKCVPGDEKHEEYGMFCALFGVKPKIRVYQSTLVTSTIMPGSSGSGVYNSSNDLVGLVFAGSGNFGYAWTVPYTSLLYFVKFEAAVIHWSKVGPYDPTAQLTAQSVSKSTLLKIKNYCRANVDTKTRKVCDLVFRDLIWSDL